MPFLDPHIDNISGGLFARSSFFYGKCVKDFTANIILSASFSIWL